MCVPVILNLYFSCWLPTFSDCLLAKGKGFFFGFSEKETSQRKDTTGGGWRMTGYVITMAHAFISPSHHHLCHLHYHRNCYYCISAAFSISISVSMQSNTNIHTYTHFLTLCYTKRLCFSNGGGVQQGKAIGILFARDPFFSEKKCSFEYTQTHAVTILTVLLLLNVCATAMKWNS